MRITDKIFKIIFFAPALFLFLALGASVKAEDVGSCIEIYTLDNPIRTDCSVSSDPLCKSAPNIVPQDACADNPPSGECGGALTNSNPTIYGCYNGATLYCCSKAVLEDAITNPNPPSPNPSPNPSADDFRFSCPSNGDIAQALNADLASSGLNRAINESNCTTLPAQSTICDGKTLCKLTQAGREQGSYCCQQVSESGPSFVGCKNEPADDMAACIDCVGDVSSPTGKIWTEIGCLDPSPAGIITRMFQIAFGILGGVGILRLMQIGVLYQSQDQEKIKEAKEMVFSLFAGIILMIMGIVILRFLGVNVLGLPDNFLGV